MARGERFKQKGRHLIVSVRIGLDPTIDRDLIELLRDVPEGGMATLIRTLMRAGLQATTPESIEAIDSGPALQITGDCVSLHNRDVQNDGVVQTVIVYRSELPGLIGRLAAAAAQLNGYRVPSLARKVEGDQPPLTLPLGLDTAIMP